MEALCPAFFQAGCRRKLFAPADASPGVATCMCECWAAGWLPIALADRGVESHARQRARRAPGAGAVRHQSLRSPGLHAAAPNFPSAFLSACKSADAEHAAFSAGGPLATFLAPLSCADAPRSAAAVYGAQRAAVCQGRSCVSCAAPCAQVVAGVALWRGAGRKARPHARLHARSAPEALVHGICETDRASRRRALDQKTKAQGAATDRAVTSQHGGLCLWQICQKAPRTDVCRPPGPVHISACVHARLWLRCVII